MARMFEFHKLRNLNVEAFFDTHTFDYQKTDIVCSSIVRIG